MLIQDLQKNLSVRGQLIDNVVCQVLVAISQDGFVHLIHVLM